MRSPLDGPGMGYGPGAGADRRGVPLVTVVLALACLLLAVTLAVVLLRPAGQTAGPAGTMTSTAPSPGPTAAETPVVVPPTPASPTAAESATPSASVTPSGTDATQRAEEPPGVRQAATSFLRAWREPKPEVRLPLLRVVATESLTEQLADVDPAKTPKAKPVGAVVVSAASDYAAVADQKMSDRTTVRMELVYDPSSRHGWLVDAIEPVE